MPALLPLCQMVGLTHLGSPVSSLDFGRPRLSGKGAPLYTTMSCCCRAGVLAFSPGDGGWRTGSVEPSASILKKENS